MKERDAIDSQLDLIADFVRGYDATIAYWKQRGASEEEAKQFASQEWEMMRRIALRDVPYAALSVNSDIILHAEGEWLAKDRVHLGVVDGLMHKLRSVATKLRLEVLKARDNAVTTFPHGVSYALTGMAPGSVIFGVSTMIEQQPEKDTIPITERNDGCPTIITDSRDALTHIASATSCISNDATLDEAKVCAMFDDPALRDAVIIGLHALSPTNRVVRMRELRISCTDGDNGTRGGTPLTKETRTMLKGHIIEPVMVAERGVFVGEVREVDLDSARFELRNVPDVGTIRCNSIKMRDARMAKSLIGGTVKVTGSYESDKKGNPRIMDVETVEDVTPMKLPLAV